MIGFGDRFDVVVESRDKSVSRCFTCNIITATVQALAATLPCNVCMRMDDDGCVCECDTLFGFDGVRVFSVEFSFPKELTFHNCQKKYTEYREPSDTNKKMAKMKFFIR